MTPKQRQQAYEKGVWECFQYMALLIVIAVVCGLAVL